MVVIVELALLAMAAAAAIAPLSASWVELRYSTTVYPVIQRALTPLSNILPFAILDVLLLAVIGGVIVVLGLAVRRAWQARSAMVLLRTVGHVAAFGAALYIVFLALWGLNYRRVPMNERLVLDRAAPSTEEVVQLGLTAVGHLNDLYTVAHASPIGPEWRDDAMRGSFALVEHALSNAALAEPGRLKHTLVGPYFRWTGVDGMVNPFGLEVIVNPELLPFERPFIAAHEWGHLAGYADESEANFIGWLTCVRGTPAMQYSGWLFLYWQIAGELDPSSRARVNTPLGEGPRRDINAVIARLRRGEVPALQAASWKVYDTYLKANRVAAGVRSYGLVVNLILRARFDRGWTPVRRPAATNTYVDPRGAPAR